MYIFYWSLRPKISPDELKRKGDNFPRMRLSASARPPILFLGIKHQYNLGNILIFLEGHNYNKQKS